MLEQKVADRLTEVFSDIETCHVEKRTMFHDTEVYFKTEVRIILNGMDVCVAWKDFITAVREGALLKLVEDDEPYTRGDIEDQCPITLIKYARQHYREHGHKTLIYSNFCECPTCGDHAHYIGNKTMLRHNADYSVSEQVEFD